MSHYDMFAADADSNETDIPYADTLATLAPVPSEPLWPWEIEWENDRARLQAVDSWEDALALLGDQTLTKHYWQRGYVGVWDRSLAMFGRLTAYDADTLHKGACRVSRRKSESYVTTVRIEFRDLDRSGFGFSIIYAHGRPRPGTFQRTKLTSFDME